MRATIWASVSQDQGQTDASSQHWTQEQLAEADGITTTYTSDLERGTKVPSLTIVLRISRALRISVADLLRDFTIDAVRRMSL